MTLLRPTEIGDLTIHLYEKDEQEDAFWSYSINGIGDSSIQYSDVETNCAKIRDVFWEAVYFARHKVDMELDNWELVRESHDWCHRWEYKLTLIDDCPVDELNDKLSNTGFQFKKWRNTFAIVLNGKTMVTLQRTWYNGGKARHWKTKLIGAVAKDFYKMTYTIKDCQGGASMPAYDSSQAIRHHVDNCLERGIQ